MFHAHIVGGDGESAMANRRGRCSCRGDISAVSAGHCGCGVVLFAEIQHAVFRNEVVAVDYITTLVSFC